jgi:hypothetical protein
MQGSAVTPERAMELIHVAQQHTAGLQGPVPGGGGVFGQVPQMVFNAYNFFIIPDAKK